LTEADWTDPENPAITPYTKSKTVAEQAAWDFVRSSGDEARMATVNPGAIIGPVLSKDRSFSIQLVERMLNGEPAVPKLGFSLVDVRDVAALQVAAMTNPAAGGQRLIAVARFAWMKEVADTLRSEMGDAANKVPKRVAPNFAIRLMSVFDGDLKSVTGSLGKKTEYSSEHARTLLGWSPRPVDESIVDTAQSLIDHGVVKSG
jgi:dihydroflavonol-4-reductase